MSEQRTPKSIVLAFQVAFTFIGAALVATAVFPEDPERGLKLLVGIMLLVIVVRFR
jgi:hypothetical protein